jgi:hypothetical protein
VVECNLAKVEVAGSNPVSRSIKTKKPGSDELGFRAYHRLEKVGVHAKASPVFSNKFSKLPDFGSRVGGLFCVWDRKGNDNFGDRRCHWRRLEASTIL